MEKTKKNKKNEERKEKKHLFSNSSLPIFNSQINKFNFPHNTTLKKQPITSL